MTYSPEPELEVWIDHGTFAVSVRLAGVVDSATGATLLGMLELCQRRSQEAGGSLVLKGVEFPQQFHQENLARWVSGHPAPTT